MAKMSALESMIASAPGGEAPMLSALAYELPAPSTAIVDRKQSCRAYPSSASSLSFTGTKSVRIRIGGEDFIDPSSLRVQFTINNPNAGQSLRPETGPWGAWQQVFLRSNGTELDNIPFYGRYHQQYGFNQLGLMDQLAVGNEGLGSSKLLEGGVMDIYEIRPTSSVTVMHRLHLSLLSAGKLLPVKFAPLEIELSMVNDAADWCTVTGDGTASTFLLENISILYDGYVLDEAVLQSFYSALLRNKVMSIGTMNAYQITHPIPAGATSYSFSSVRAFSRLAQVWLTFRKDKGRNYSFVCPGTLPGEADVNELDFKNGTGIPQARLSIGPHNWPDPQPVTTATEYHMMLTKALGYSPNITRKRFENDCFTIVWDIKKNPGDPTSAVSTRSGDLVRIDLTNLTANAATECFMTLISFGVCAIRESGVTLLT